MLSDDEYTRIQSHLKAAKESLCLAMHFAQNDQSIQESIRNLEDWVKSEIHIVEQERRVAVVMSLPQPVV